MSDHFRSRAFVVVDLLDRLEGKRATDHLVEDLLAVERGDPGKFRY
jgi:hypothetical protein